MNSTKTSRMSLVTAAVAAVTLGLAGSAQAQTLKILHSFTGKWDGGAPYGGVMFDSAGNIYGTTTTGGNPTTCAAYGGCGVVYKLAPTSSGAWQETPIYRFTSAATGATPEGNLVMDSAGDIFGTDLVGGNSPLCSGAVQGCGLVYELTPTPTGPWQETVPQIFDNGADGGFSYDGLVADAAGNFYGTTSDGGANYCQGTGCGVVFELSTTSSAGWQEHVLYSFTGGTDGARPSAHLIFDAAGNLYGTAYAGGNLPACTGQGCGVVFELSPSSTGAWTQKVLHTFSGKGDGAEPFGALAFDSAGNLYGTTYFGGIPADCGGYGCGVVFKLAPTANSWSESLLHTFTSGADGASPNSGVVLDASGNVYGVTSSGGKLINGCYNTGCGVIFKLSSNSSGRWQESVLHTFTGGTDGALPEAPLTFGPDGDLYGTAYLGGTSNAGVVFKIAP